MNHISREVIHLDQIRFIRHKVNDFRRICSFAEWELYYSAIPHSHSRYLREMLWVSRDLASHDLNVLDEIIYGSYLCISKSELCQLKEGTDKLTSQNLKMKADITHLMAQLADVKYKAKELQGYLAQEQENKEELQIQLNIHVSHYQQKEGNEKNTKLNVQRLQKSNRQLWKDRDQLSTENKIIKEQLRKEINKAEQFKTLYNNLLKAFNRRQEEYMKTNERGDYELLQERNEILRSEVNRLNGEHLELQQLFQQVSDDNQNLSKELKFSKESPIQQDSNKLLKMEESIHKLKNEIVQMAHVKQALEEDLKLEKANALIKEKEHIRESSHLQHTIQEQTQEISHLNAELQSRVEETSLSRDHNVGLGPEKQIHSNEDILLQLEESRNRLIKVQQELDDTKSRLSRAMGDKLTDNNPNIADLSDKNRPTNISERFQELYDNQWTDAFEVINKGRKDEEKTINALMTILEDAMKFCTTEAAKQMTQIKESFLKEEELPSNMRKPIKDCRKATAELYGKGLFRNYWTTLCNSQSEEASLATKVPDYVKECFEICWLMAVQDPPVVFGPDIRHNDDFNKDHYKAYTKSGDRVEYVVWPVLLLYKDGPVLCKGVAQGKEMER